MREIIDRGNGKTAHVARYYNDGDHGIVIVASVNKYGVTAEGKQLGDWTAYIGATSHLDIKTDAGTVDETLDHGVKLTRIDARHFFPELAAGDLPWRE